VARRYFVDNIFHRRPQATPTDGPAQMFHDVWKWTSNPTRLPALGRAGRRAPKFRRANA
jgi:hypothetical protein